MNLISCLPLGSMVSILFNYSSFFSSSRLAFLLRRSSKNKKKVAMEKKKKANNFYFHTSDEIKFIDNLVSDLQ